jgi:toxin ParE1/3/4
MGSYKLSEAAEDDLRELYRYGVLTFGPAVADKYYDGLISRFEEIAERPRLYQAIDAIRHGYRRSVCGVHSLYYRITPEGVTIMRILRGQNPEDALPD